MKIRIALLFLTAVAGWSATVPAGTKLQVRLTTEVSSDKPSGQPVSAVLIVPALVGTQPAISAGATLTGTTADANTFQAATDQVKERAATLRLLFTRIQDEGGHAQPLECVVEGVDNARESVDQSGLITGIVASQTMEAEIEKGISKVESRYQQLGQILSSVKGALLKNVDASIDYKPGVELTLRLTKPLEWKAPAASNIPAPITPQDQLVALVNAEPFRTAALNPPRPSDLTNLMFIGTAEQVEEAFREAGWFAANALSQFSKFETARAIIEDRGYSEAPMSILYIDGKPPDFTFQKQNDTFAMRHHIRIWRRPETFAGKPVWIAAATHDIKISISPVTHSFTHGIDSNIDQERSKVMSDLLFTRRVHAVALVDRNGLPRDASNATGDKLATDGRMGVLEF